MEAETIRSEEDAQKAFVVVLGPGSLFSCGAFFGYGFEPGFALVGSRFGADPCRCISFLFGVLCLRA